MDEFKICPKCGAEYYPEIQVCADCGVALVWSSTQVPVLTVEEELDEEDQWWGTKKGDPQRETDGDWGLFGEDEILCQVAGDRERIIGQYRVRLARVGIPTAVLPTTRYQKAESYLEQSVVFGNREVVIPAGQVPVGDVLNGFNYDLFVRRADWPRADEITRDMFAELHPDMESGFYNEFELGKCPACGAEVPEDATECPDCGLPLADPAE